MERVSTGSSLAALRGPGLRAYASGHLPPYRKEQCPRAITQAIPLTASPHTPRGTLLSPGAPVVLDMLHHAGRGCQGHSPEQPRVPGSNQSASSTVELERGPCRKAATSDVAGVVPAKAGLPSLRLLLSCAQGGLWTGAPSSGRDLELAEGRCSGASSGSSRPEHPSAAHCGCRGCPKTRILR